VVRFPAACKAIPASADSICVDRRREPRLAANQAALLTTLTEPCLKRSGTIVNVAGRGINVSLEQPLPVDVPVRIDLDDTLALGEVCYCEPTEGRYSVGIQVDQILNGLESLLRLNEALLGETPRNSSGENSPETAHSLQNGRHQNQK